MNTTTATKTVSFSSVATPAARIALLIAETLGQTGTFVTFTSLGGK